MCSSTTTPPYAATRIETSACGNENDFASALPATASAASAAARRTLRRRRSWCIAGGGRCRSGGRGCWGFRLEADRRYLAGAVALDLEELAPREAEGACDQHGREHLNPVVVGQHRVVVDLSRHGDLVLRVLELRLEVEEVGARLQVRVGLGDCEQASKCLAEDALCSGGLRRSLRAHRGGASL